jgi:uncharacterized damage-inducible protein DinB
MYTPAALIDLHTRVHQSLRGLMEHCSGFSAEELSRELDGFGQSSIRMQLHHVIGAEQYWVGVLRGEMLVDENPADYESLSALESFRERIVAVTADYLADASDAELNTRRPMITWGGKEKELLPAHIILRTQTHIFQHMGQVTAMCRLLGRPVPPGLDFPLG